MMERFHRNFGSSAFDDEGVPTSRKILIEKAF